MHLIYLSILIFRKSDKAPILEDAKVTAVMSFTALKLKRHYQSFNWKMLKVLVESKENNNMMIYMAINLKTQRC